MPPSATAPARGHSELFNEHDPHGAAPSGGCPAPQSHPIETPTAPGRPGPLPAGSCLPPRFRLPSTPTDDPAGRRPSAHHF